MGKTKNLLVSKGVKGNIVKPQTLQQSIDIQDSITGGSLKKPAIVKKKFNI